LLAETVDHGVDHDPPHPSLERDFGTAFLQVQQHLQEALVHPGACILPVVLVAGTDRKHHRVQRSVQLMFSPRVLADASGDQAFSDHGVKRKGARGPGTLPKLSTRAQCTFKKRCVRPCGPWPMRTMYRPGSNWSVGTCSRLLPLPSRKRCPSTVRPNGSVTVRSTSPAMRLWKEMWSSSSTGFGQVFRSAMAAVSAMPVGSCWITFSVKPDRSCREVPWPSGIRPLRMP